MRSCGGAAGADRAAAANGARSTPTPLSYGAVGLFGRLFGPDDVRMKKKIFSEIEC